MNAIITEGIRTYSTQTNQTVHLMEHGHTKQLWVLPEFDIATASGKVRVPHWAGFGVIYVHVGLAVVESHVHCSQRLRQVELLRPVTVQIR